MKGDIERIFIRKADLNNEDRVKVFIDKYLRGELSNKGVDTAHSPKISPKNSMKSCSIFLSSFFFLRLSPVACDKDKY